MQCTDTGTLRVMSKSLQEYKFTSEGMTRGNSGLLRGDQSYKVCLPFVAVCIAVGLLLCFPSKLDVAARPDLTKAK